MDVKSTGLIVNKAPGGKIAKAIMEEIKAGVGTAGVVPWMRILLNMTRAVNL